jgi:NADH dehydrogenase FAD-containing subunit
MSSRKVVIVGAGASARILVKTLRAGKAKNLHITVVQPNKFASLPYYQTLVLTQKDTLANNSTFQPIEGVDETVYGIAVTCADGVLAVQPLNDQGAKDESPAAVVKEVPFDILVAATGSSFPILTETPGQSQAERQQEIDQVSKALLNGKDAVVIAGGGATGVELAGDVLEALPAEGRKGKVTLICSSDRLLADQPPYYGEKCKQVLEELGCKIIFNDRVKSHSDSAIGTSDAPVVTLTLKSGTTLPCQAYIAAYARGANTSWLTIPHGGKGGLPSKLINEKGKVEVNEYLQSTVYDKLYALAVTNSRTEPSLIMNVEAQAKTAASNILKPNSASVAPGVAHAVYQIVGHDSFATLIPENLPMPGFCATLCCQWCGYPANLLCPCWCCAVVCGPVDHMTCGYCCGKPEGMGLPNTLKNTKEMGVMAQMAGYVDPGKVAPAGEGMDR